VGIYWNRGAARMVFPPRALITGFERGIALGEPNAETTHMEVLRKAIALLSETGPLMESL
jgi:hypothetical protein